MELPSATEHAKTKEVSREYFDRIVQKIVGNKTGRETMMCGSYTCSIPQRDLAISLLKEKGYSVTMSHNSPNVPYLIIKW